VNQNGKRLEIKKREKRRKKLSVTAQEGCQLEAVVWKKSGAFRARKKSMSKSKVFEHLGFQSGCLEGRYWRVEVGA